MTASDMDAIASVQKIKAADPDYDIADVFRTRWSPRAFADRPVEPAKIRRMLEAARWTMSSYNEQPLVGSNGPRTRRC